MPTTEKTGRPAARGSPAQNTDKVREAITNNALDTDAGSTNRKRRC